MKFYRYQTKVRSHGGTTEWGDWEYLYSTTELELLVYTVDRETPKGYWLALNGWTKKRWISKNGYKRFAHETKKDALEAYVKRTKNYIHILEKRIRTAKQGLKIAEKGVE